LQKAIRKLPRWLLILIGVLLSIVVGLLDYVTGDYSLLIFYAIPVVLEGWFVGRWGVAVVAVVAGLARFLSDYVSYSNSGIRYWNSLEDTVFLLFVGILVSTVKGLLADEDKGRPKE
jgi:hypothetical protein